MNSERIKKLESVSHNIISEYFTQYITGELMTEHGIININEIKISPDLSYLDIYVSSFKNNDTLPKSLKEYSKGLQKSLNKKLEIRKLPRIRFRSDNKGETSSNICNIINKITNQ